MGERMFLFFYLILFISVDFPIFQLSLFVLVISFVSIR